MPITDSSDGAVPFAPRGPSRKRIIVLSLLALLAIAAGVNYGWHWWTTGRFEEATDDAFLQADKGDRGAQGRRASSPKAS